MADYDHENYPAHSGFSSGSESPSPPPGNPPTHSTPKPKRPNPIATAITAWLQEKPELQFEMLKDDLLEKAPKRWSVYEPMVLLPSGSFTAYPWTTVLEFSTPDQRDSLWGHILAAISPAGTALTHLAVNEGIPSVIDEEDGEENVLRSPSGLKILYGDFGPVVPVGEKVGAEDFERAFWVRTKQNGIVQIWAPRYTMFSRGNVKEKARLLGFPAKGEGEGDRWAVDLYAGIGYFVFSYAKLGLRTLCWEINPWSVEGLRRGAVANGWDVIVVGPREVDGVEGGEERLADMVGDGEGPRIVVFLESNEFAEGRVVRLREELLRMKAGGLDLVHVNCGFLPSSRGVWEDAWGMMAPRYVEGHRVYGVDGWLHLHENVGIRDVEKRKEEIQAEFDRWSVADHGVALANVEHVEMVKTFAPDVWHVVFDIRVQRNP